MFMSMLQLNVPKLALGAVAMTGESVTLRGLTAEQFAKNRGEPAGTVRMFAMSAR